MGVMASAFASVPIGEHVHVAPASSEASHKELMETYLKPHFTVHAAGAHRPVSRGDFFTVRAGVRSMEFQVLGVSPGDSVVVCGETAVLCDFAPFKREREDKRAPASPRVPFSAMIAVTVRNLEGEELLDELDMLRTVTITEVKERMREKAYKRLVEGEDATRARTFLAMGCGIKLIHERRGLEDLETFESEGYEATVQLTAVLFVRMHSALAWGDCDAGGDTDRVRDQLAGRLTQIFSTSRAFAALTTAGG